MALRRRRDAWRRGSGKCPGESRDSARARAGTVPGQGLGQCPWRGSGGAAAARPTAGGRRHQDPGEVGLRDGAQVVTLVVDDHARRRAATNQFTVARTCVLMKKASQRVRKCVLIRSMFQVTCSCRSQPYRTPAMPLGATPRPSGTTANRLRWWRQFGPGPAPMFAGRHVFAGALRYRSGVAVRHGSGGGARARPASFVTVTAPRPSPRSLRGRGDRGDDGRRVTASRRRTSPSIAARAPC